MSKISVPVLWDGAGNFLNGKLFEVSAESIVVGIAKKPAGMSVPGFAVDTVDTLQIKDPILDTLFLPLTEAQWVALASGYNPYTSPFQPVQSVVLDYTLAATDNQNLLLVTGGPGSITVPADLTVPIPIGFQADVVQNDAGAVSFTAEGGVTINSQGGNLTIGAQYVGVTIEKVDTDTWILFGSLIV